MNYVMLGHSSAGKTTYMAALYYRMANGIYDYKMTFDRWENYWYKRYTLDNKNYDYEESQKEEEELKKTSEDVSRGIYPPATAIKQEYVFNVTYKDFHDVTFKWFDYRGGALNERSSQSSDTSDLMRKIKSCDALLVFLDGLKLEESANRNERSLQRLVYLIKNAIANVSVEDGAYFPISFIITKSDLCHDFFNSSGFRYMHENLFKDIIQNGRVAGLITWTQINSKTISNVHFPLFFSLYHCMHKFEMEAVDSYQSRKRNRGLFDSIKEFFTEEDKKDTLLEIEQLNKSREYLGGLLQEKRKKEYLYLI